MSPAHDEMGGGRGSPGRLAQTPMETIGRAGRSRSVVIVAGVGRGNSVGMKFLADDFW
jgi:hypothetical protein